MRLFSSILFCARTIVQGPYGPTARIRTMDTCAYARNTSAYTHVHTRIHIVHTHKYNTHTHTHTRTHKYAHIRTHTPDSYELSELSVLEPSLIFAPAGCDSYRLAPALPCYSVLSTLSCTSYLKLSEKRVLFQLSSGVLSAR